MVESARARSTARWIAPLLAAFCVASPSLRAQTITGRLLDSQSGRPIDLGILALLTLEHDTVGLTATNPDGRFSIASPEAGTFLLQSSAFGHSERIDGEFELGEDGRLDVEVRIAPLALALEDMLVSVERAHPNHPLIRNGFVRRYQQGFGHFITPRDLERSVYFNTEALFTFVPGVRVLTSSQASVGGRSVLGPSTDRVVMRNPFGRGWCAPAVLVDGIRMEVSPSTGETLSLVMPIAGVEAVEIYRRPAEIPAEFAGAANVSGCGVIAFWTKS